MSVIDELKVAAQEAKRQGNGLLYQKIMLRIMTLVYKA